MILDKQSLASLKEWHELAKGSMLQSGLIFADPTKIDDLIETVEALQKELEYMQEHKRRSDYLANL